MAAGWVDAVGELWREDKEFDFAALENTWRLKTFETGGGIPQSPFVEQRERFKLICCLTGFEDSTLLAFFLFYLIVQRRLPSLCLEG